MKKWTLGLLVLVFLALCACSAADADGTAAEQPVSRSVSASSAVQTRCFQMCFISGIHAPVRSQ